MKPRYRLVSSTVDYLYFRNVNANWYSPSHYLLTRERFESGR